MDLYIAGHIGGPPIWTSINVLLKFRSVWDQLLSHIIGPYIGWSPMYDPIIGLQLCSF